MKLDVSKREKKAKSNLSQLRYEGNIPGILYSPGKENVSIIVDGKTFQAAMRHILKGHLPTTVFEFELEGKKVKAVVKEIQYHPTTYNILHLDLLALDDKTQVTVNVPVEFTGVAECVGIKLGGFLRQVKHHLPVKCLPKDIPTHFVVDIQDLSIGHSKRVKDLHITEKVRPLATEEDVVVVIAKR